MSDPGKAPAAPRWTSPTGEVISCVEKLKVLRENLDEIRGLCQDAIDDAVLMGCDEAQFREVLVQLAASIESAYKGLPEK
ncbi:MAG TPA: hypothetical protein VN598_09985 [Usitatibacter sp.]|nr:hypothetical protein [Usitatibacter sp.]